jgi:hypothetical protein
MALMLTTFPGAEIRLFAILPTMDTDAKPKRRFLRFSTRTLLLMILIAAVISSAIAWRLKAPDFEVIGNLGRSDVAAICKTIAAAPTVPVKTILVIQVISLDKVEVETGFIGGPLSGGGNMITFEKSNGVWRIISVRYWVS